MCPGSIEHPESAQEAGVLTAELRGSGADEDLAENLLADGPTRAEAAESLEDDLLTSSIQSPSLAIVGRRSRI
jgi:hypothetical protein